MDLEFRNLTYTVRHRITKANPRQVVKGVHGRFSSGTLVAIMGPSGAGKSSLLNTISGYRSEGVTGSLLVNGEPRDEHAFQRQSCYITQEDLLQPMLTVREAMDVAASLKLPKGAKAHSEQVLKQLGLLEHQHTKTDMLSGGQKKRLSIALELVNNPPVFFLDEPTSGLDTVTTVQCVKLLRQLARQGRTVVATIHQPAASLLELFDQVYVMANGECIFQGDTAAMVPYLQSVGLPCPRHHNPADFIIELTEHQEYVDLLRDEIQNGKVYKSAKEPILQLNMCYQNGTSVSNDILSNVATVQMSQISASNQSDDATESHVMLSNDGCTYKVSQYSDETSGSSSSLSSQVSETNTLPWMKIQKQKVVGAYATTWGEQFRVLLMRMLLQLWRNKQGLWIQLFHHITCSLLIGTCFFNMANDGTQMFNHLKMCIGLVIFFAYTQIMVPVLLFPQEVKLVKKEHFNRWYGLSSYYAALTVSKLPLQVFFNLLFCTVVFFMIGVPYSFIRYTMFCFVANVISLVSESIGLAIGSVFNVTNGCAVGPTVMAPFLGLAIYGFDFAHRIPTLMNIIMKTSFIRCGVVAMVLTIFGFGRKPLDCEDVYCHFAKPDVLMKYLDIEKSSVWTEVLIMVTIMVAFRSASYFGLRWRFAT